MIAVIDYGMGNLRSVSKALESLGAEVVVTNRIKDLETADRIVLTCVGSFYQGMAHLRELNLVDALRREVLEKKKQFLGICLGMQLCAETGEEHGRTEGLGWFGAKVIGLHASRECKVPHMGWNDVDFIGDNPLFKGFKNPTTFYFVHSYHFVANDQSLVTGVCEHGQSIAAAVSQDNIHLVQFHPEKSQNKGLALLENLLNL
jgi:imidazole glycerol-phosphate synthase subunit HisH